jgi:hypothetical protein
VFNSSGVEFLSRRKEFNGSRRKLKKMSLDRNEGGLFILDIET